MIRVILLISFSTAPSASLFREANHNIFRVNARTTTEKDYKRAGLLKDAHSSQSRVKPRNLPLKWFGFIVYSS